MVAVVWDASYEIGHPVFDREHHRLVLLLGTLAELESQPIGQVATKVGVVVDELVRYTETHFAHEEQEMAQWAVDRRHQLMHLSAHRAFEAEMRALKSRPVTELRLPAVVKLLVDWLVGHIVAHDRVMVQQLQAIQAGATPEGAYATCHLAAAVAAVPAPATLSAAADERVATSEMLVEQMVEGAPVATFVLDMAHRVVYWNRACVQLTGWPAHKLVGTTEAWRGLYDQPRPTLADLMLAPGESPVEQIRSLYGEDFQPSPAMPGAFEGVRYYPALGQGGRWLHITATALRDASGRTVGAIETLQDVTEARVSREQLLQAQQGLEREVEARTAELVARNAELTRLNQELLDTRQQLVQAEKLASIGQLAAGVAHEINNPIGYVYSNLATLGGYVHDVFALIQAYGRAEQLVSDPAVVQQLADLRSRIDLPYLLEDMPNLIQESHEGAARVKKIVQDLKDFSRAEVVSEFAPSDLHHGLDSTLNIVTNELKYRADVVREYGNLPPVECVLSQLNQVFMNLLVNAAQAMPLDRRGTIHIRTWAEDGMACVDVKDNGVGMPPDVQQRVFDPFFTTKPVGKGTGLGLALAYGIVQHHGGTLTLDSEPGVGTVFHVRVPLRQAGQQDSVAQAGQTGQSGQGA